jgi:hypothetical protein
MTVNLPTEEDLHRPFYRVLICNDWKAQNWAILPMVQREDTNTSGNGYEVLEWERVVLPALGRARFQYRFGIIDGRVYPTPEDMTDYYIRIQVAEGVVELNHGGSAIENWKTVFIGTVEYQEDHLSPGGNYASGLRVYHCVDILGVTRRQRLAQHGYSFDGSAATSCLGVINYNYSKTDGSLGGNKGVVTWTPTTAIAASTFCHGWHNDGTYWTDLEVANHALLSAHATIEAYTVPVFIVVDAPGLLSNSNAAWQVHIGQSPFNLIAHILDRRRGRGCALVTWADDSGDPQGPLTLSITVFSQVAADITYTKPVAGGAVTLPGAITNATVVALVDLEGDHRNIAPTFQLGDRHQNEYGYVEGVGEPIEVAVTVDYLAGSIEKGWTDTEKTAWKAALDAGIIIRDGFIIHHQAAAIIYEYVFQRHAIAHDKKALAGNGNGLTPTAYDYQCDGGGNIGFSGVSSDEGETSPLSCTPMRDMCVPNPCADQTHGIIRDKPRAWVHVGGTGVDKYLDVQNEIGGVSMAVRFDGILLRGEGADQGVRYFSDITYFGARYDYTKILFSITMQLPHRIRMAYGDPHSTRRLPSVYIPGLRLWITHPGYIKTLDYTSGSVSAGHPPVRPGYTKVVDDRDRLAFAVARLSSWYQQERRNCSWQLRACYAVPWYPDNGDGSGKADMGSPQTFTQIGQVVQAVQAGGTPWPINTPCTRIHFDAIKHVSTWVTDWSELDLR